MGSMLELAKWENAAAAGKISCKKVAALRSTSRSRGKEQAESVKAEEIRGQ